MKRAERRRGAAQQARAGERRRLGLYLTLGVLALAAIVAVALGSRVPKSATEVHSVAPLKVGELSPGFAVSTTAGLFDSTEHRGKVIVLEVFATWCPHCQREVPTLNRLWAQYRDIVSFVAVSGSNVGIDQQSPESQADVIAFAQRYGVKYPIAYDPDLIVARKYLQSGFPTIVVIDRAGKIASFADGELPEATLRARIESALNR